MNETQVTVPLRPPASAAELAENTRLRREVAEAYHKRLNRTQRFKQEVDFWQQRALELQLQLVDDEAQQCTHSAVEFEGPGLQLATASVASAAQHSLQELTIRVNQCQEAREQLEQLKANCRAAEERLRHGNDVARQLQARACRQAVKLLTRQTKGPAQTFVSSLVRFDLQTLLWVRDEIDRHRKERDLERVHVGTYPRDGSPGVGSGNPEVAPSKRGCAEASQVTEQTAVSTAAESALDSLNCADFARRSDNCTMPSTTSARLNTQLGSTHRFSQFLNAVVVAIIAAALMPVFSYLPQATIASILVVSSIRMTPVSYLKKLWAENRTSFTVCLVTGAVCVGEDPVIGLAVGMVLALLMGAKATLKADLMSVESQISGGGRTYNVELSGSLTYVNSEKFIEKARKLEDPTEISIDMFKLRTVDHDGATALEKIMKIWTSEEKGAPEEKVCIKGVGNSLLPVLRSVQWFQKAEEKGRVSIV